MNYRISVVSYINTLPFIHGITNSLFSDNIDLILDYPSVCANKLINGDVDLALCPVVVLKSFPNFNIISDYCIGSDGYVETVCLFSNVPLKNIEKIYLDFQSKTSVELIKILCSQYWKISPVFINSTDQESTSINDNKTASLVIGDRAFSLNKKYPYIYDLSYYWKKFTGSPFVFACWISNKKLDIGFINDFNFALQDGLNNIDEIVQKRKQDFPGINLENYLRNRISYNFDDEKKEAMRLFLQQINY